MRATERSPGPVLDVKPRREYTLSHCDQRSVRLSLLLWDLLLRNRFELPRSRVIAIENRTLARRADAIIKARKLIACGAVFV